MNSIQLSVRGKPSAFDLSASNDICAVSSPGCISFFHLHGLGSPRHVIHYEQPHQIRLLRFQRSTQQLLSTLRGGSISIWDPSKLLRPLNGFIRSKGWITHTEWSNFSPYQLCTSSDDGEVSVWDVRSLSRPSSSVNISGKIVNSVEWCPFNPHYICCHSSDQGFAIWDIRMSNKLNLEKNVFVCSGDQGVISTGWFSDESNPTVYVGKNNGTLDWWSVSHLSSSSDSVYCMKDRSLSTWMDGTSITLSSPIGRGLVYSKSDESQAQSQSRFSTSIFLQGYARDGYSLESLFSNTSNNMQSSGPHLKLATIDETILGMRWGTPGRLVPPSHSGLELLIFTESARIQAIKIAADVVNHFCGGLPSSALSYDPGKLLLSPTSSTGSSAGSNMSPRSAASLIDSTNSIAMPVFSVDNLRTSFLSETLSDKNTSTMVKKNSSGSQSRRSSFQSENENLWSHLQSEILNLDDQIKNRMFEGLVIGRVDQFARQITLDMHSLKFINSMSRDSLSEKDSFILSGSSERDDIISLVIYFPSVPVFGIPSFTIRTHQSAQVNFSLALYYSYIN